MEKLKEILNYHFWILGGVVLILPLIAWWSASASMSQRIQDRISAIDQSFSSARVSGKANPRWTDNVKTFIEREQERVTKSRSELWERQQRLMRWPATMREWIPEQHRGQFANKGRTIYRDEYAAEVERVWRAADPFDVETGTGKVVLDMNMLPQDSFGELPPASERMWNAQEDLWLLESLLKAVKEMNIDSSLVTESVIREVSVIQLMGGSGEKPAAEGSSSEGSEYGEDMYTEERNYESRGGGRRGGSGGLSLASASFDPIVEFGSPEDASGGGDLDSEEEMYASDYGAGDAANQLRYIGPQEGGPFLKRGFYMEVLMDHRKVPEFLVALTNADWPVTIKRVQFAKASEKNSSRSRNRFSNRGAGRGPAAANSFMENYEDDYETSSGRRGGSSSLAGSQLQQAATSGYHLASVAIAGEIVIYNPPEQEEEQSEEQAEEATTDDTTTEAGTTTDPTADETGTDSDDSTDESEPVPSGLNENEEDAIPSPEETDVPTGIDGESLPDETSETPISE